MTPEAEPIEPGSTWRHRYRPGAYVVVESTRLWPDATDLSVYVWRNTSRRRQAIMARTLRRHYRLDPTVPLRGVRG